MRKDLLVGLAVVGAVAVLILVLALRSGQSYGERAAIYLLEKEKFEQMDKEAVEQSELREAVEIVNFRTATHRDPNERELTEIRRKVDNMPEMVTRDLALQKKGVELAEMKKELDAMNSTHSK